MQPCLHGPRIIQHLLAAVEKHLERGERVGRWLASVSWSLGTLCYLDPKATDATMQRVVEVAERTMRAQLHRREQARAVSAAKGQAPGLATWSTQQMKDFNDMDVSGFCIGLARARCVDAA